MAAVPTYWFDRYKVALWNMDPQTGELTFRDSIALSDGDLRGSYQHTIRWLDGDSFLVSVTQERTQGDGKSEQGVWYVNVPKRMVKSILRAKDLMEGVSDLFVSNKRLFVAEGNVAQVLAKEAAPGHVSVWDISNPLVPLFLKRFSAGDPLPSDFSNAHNLGGTSDGKFVYVESFSSNYMIKIDVEKLSVVRTYGKLEGMDVPHGIYLQG
jgi:hypothetical protein